jgi:hypothetical protein
MTKSAERVVTSLGLTALTWWVHWAVWNFVIAVKLGAPHLGFWDVVLLNAAINLAFPGPTAWPRRAK